MHFTYFKYLIIVSVWFAFKCNGQESNETTTEDKFSIVNDEKFISINGQNQWITIKGNKSKPILFFIHGGPGSPISPYSDSLFKSWQKDFIIVQWDQRGTGKTYGANAPPEELTPEYLQANPLTLAQMTKDGVEVTSYLLKYLEKNKLILFGTSWGSALAAKMATDRPELYYAYVGHSQIVKPAIDLNLYDKIFSMAKAKNDTAAISKLIQIGKPPYARARSVGQLFRILKQFERAKSKPAPAAWFVESPSYDNAKDNQNRSDGDDYSFVNYVGDKVLGVKAMMSTIDLMTDHRTFKIPVFFIQGEEDIMTPAAATNAYFRTIRAPAKKIYTLPNTAHGFNEAVVEKLYEICKSISTK